jgi:hypothetical protein
VCDLSLDLTFDKDGDLDLTFWRDVEYSPDPSETRLGEYLREKRDKINNRDSRMWGFLYDLNQRVADIVCFSRRVRDAYKVLFNKEIKLEGGLIIYGEENITNFIKTLIEGSNFALNKE